MINISPFGPKLGIVKIDDDTISTLIDLTDNILSDKNKVSNGSNLAGQLEQEIIIPIELLKENNLYDFFTDNLKEYLSQIIGKEPLENNVDVNITDMWVNSQYENEYNPMHWHEGCTLSATMYLKIPEYTPRNIKGKKGETDGNIIFINNNHNSPFESLENGIYGFQPTAGDLFIWPSRLIHGVYPFKGDGERRSIAFNGLHKFKKEAKNDSNR